VVAVEFPEGGRGWLVLDSAGGMGAAGAATVVVVATDRDGFSERGCIHDGVYGSGLWRRLFLVTVI
jgi:hypothetical protein